MKQLNLLSLCMAFCMAFLFVSCGGDDDGPSGTPTPTPNPGDGDEANPIELSILEEGISIAGATEIDGNAPAPNSNIDFGVSSNQQNGFQNTGYTITFNSAAAVDGAFIQFLGSDFSRTRSHLQVPQSAFGGKKGLFDNDSRKSTLKSGKTAMNTEYEINVNFDSSVPVGSFCYEICIYDIDGNISQAETVCVTVKNWGGNTEIVGEWIYDRDEPSDPNDPDTVFCNNGGIVVVPNSFEGTDSWTFTLNADGSYFEEYEIDGEELDYNATAENCQAIFVPIGPEQDRYEGQWSFDQQAQTLTVVDFRYVNVQDPTQNEEYPNGELYFEGVTAQVVNDELILSQEEDGITYRTIFKRK